VIYPSDPGLDCIVCDFLQVLYDIQKQHELSHERACLYREMENQKRCSTLFTNDNAHYIGMKQYRKEINQKHNIT